jgi:VWFA-related protein
VLDHFHDMTILAPKGLLWSGVALAATVGVAVSAAQIPQSSTLPTPTFRVTTTLVTTDVIPRDSGGRFVSDLTAHDFTITEDGTLQTIASFSLIHGGRTFNLMTPPASVPEGVVLPTGRSRVANDTSGRLILIFVDDLHFEADYTPHVRRLVQTLATTLLHEGDLVAMISSGPSALEVDATYNRQLIASSVSKIRGTGLTAAEVFQLPETSQGAADLRRRAQLAFQRAYGMLAELEQVREKRKVVIYISGGYDFDPFAAGRQMSDRIQGGRFSDPTRFLIDEENPYLRLPAVTADIDLYSYMRELTLSANRANATIYTVDPRGLSGVVDAGQFLDQSEWRTFLQKTQSSLRYLAEATRGFAVVNANDFATEFKRIDAETSNYYLIGYYSTKSDAGKRVRSLDVKVSRPGVEVAARSAYSLKTAGTLPAPTGQDPRR